MLWDTLGRDCRDSSPRILLFTGWQHLQVVVLATPVFTPSHSRCSSDPKPDRDLEKHESTGVSLKEELASIAFIPTGQVTVTLCLSFTLSRGFLCVEYYKSILLWVVKRT